MERKSFWGRLKSLAWWKWLLIAFAAFILVILVYFAYIGIMSYRYYEAYKCYRCNHAYTKSDINQDHTWDYRNTRPISQLSENITFRKSEMAYNYPFCSGYLFNEKTKRLVSENTPGLLWIMFTPDDSLAIGAIWGGRGFFNRFSGKQVLPFDYTRAWFFSEGVAAVTDNADNLFFIDKKGNRTMTQTFRYSPDLRYEGYVFHNGNCLMNNLEGRVGMIDHNGEWKIRPTWDKIIWRSGYWELRDNGQIQLLDSTLRTIVPKMEATESRLYNDGNILVEIPHKPSRLYTTQGKLISESVIAETYPLYYRVDHIIDHSSSTPKSDVKAATCSKYRNFAGEYGLINNKGRIVTDAIYIDIEAVDYNIFRARLSAYPRDMYVMINANGKEINASKTTTK